MRRNVYSEIIFSGSSLNPEEMSAKERRELNEYHQMVYEKVSPYLTDEEREWLKTYTRPI